MPRRRCGATDRCANNGLPQVRIGRSFLHMRRVLLCLSLLAATAGAQDKVPPAAPAADQGIGDALTFGANGPRMTVPVEIAGAGPYAFIIDTGAQRTVISRELAATLGLSPARNVRVTSMSGVGDAHTVMIPSLSVSSLGGERIEAPVFEQRHLGSLGMLGIDSLQGHALAIDFDARTMAVTPSSKREHRLAARSDEIVIVAKTQFGQLIVTDAYVGNQRVRVILDTGSVVSMGNPALRRKLIRGARKANPIQLISVTGGALTADYTVIDGVRMGGLSINQLPIAFADAAPFAKFGLENKPAIMLGMDALKLFRSVRIDFANRELRLGLPRDVRRPI